MAKVAGIYIGGREQNGQGHFRSGVAFNLHPASRKNKVFVFNNGKWEVEIRQGSSVIVARCKNKCGDEETVTKGYRFCQESLDLLAVANEGLYSMPDASSDYQVLFLQQSKFILRHYALIDWEIRVEAEIFLNGENGKLVPVAPENQLQWHESFRYYRTSQTSHDVFEAYRNLFLGFESLLNTVCPRNRSEGEIEWLRRGLTFLRAGVSLDAYVPSGVDPIEHFITNQYKAIRCKIFHAKDRNTSLLPFQLLNPVIVQRAYESLLQLWRQIATVHLNTSSAGTGLMTVDGFKHMLDQAFQKGASICVTKDPTPISKTDEVVSPCGHPYTECETPQYRWNQSTRRAVLKSKLQGDNLSHEPRICRICSFVEGHMFTGSFVPGGIETTGIDSLEFHLEIRLDNKSMPKTIF